MDFLVSVNEISGRPDGPIDRPKLAKQFAELSSPPVIKVDADGKAFEGAEWIWAARELNIWELKVDAHPDFVDKLTAKAEAKKRECEKREIERKRLEQLAESMLAALPQPGVINRASPRGQEILDKRNRQIFEQYSSGWYTLKEIGKMHGISSNAVRDAYRKVCRQEAYQQAHKASRNGAYGGPYAPKRTSFVQETRTLDFATENQGPRIDGIASSGRERGVWIDWTPEMQAREMGLI